MSIRRIPLEPYRRPDPVVQILGRIRYAGMRWEVEGGQIYVTGNTKNLTPEHREDIDKHRAEITATLERLPSSCVMPHLCRELGTCHPERCARAANQTADEQEQPHG